MRRQEWLVALAVLLLARPAGWARDKAAAPPKTSLIAVPADALPFRKEVTLKADNWR